MEINLVYDQSVTALGANVTVVEAALNAAASYLDNLIINPITVNISVGWGEDGGQALAPGDLAEGGPDYGSVVSYPQITNDLRASATSALDQSAYGTLPASDPTGSNHYYVASAQEKAWGLLPADASAIDGSVGFSSSVRWNFDPSDRAVAGEYDFIGIAEHELTHALGRIAGLGENGFWTAQDLFRYAAPGVLQPSASRPAYFSTDGGQTGQAYQFDTTGSDPADWAGLVTGDSLAAYAQAGTVLNFSQTDVNEMDVLGFQISGDNPTATPPSVAVANLTTGADSQQKLTPYSAPGTGLNWAFADITPDSLYVSTTTSGVFLVAGSGNNVVQASAGQNVLSVGTGTDLLIGGTGTATFYLDGRNPGPSWSTIADFNPGDAMILWGWQGNVTKMQWQDGQGLAGWQGATLHTGLYGTGSNESLTFTGLTAAQAAGFEIGAGNAYGTPFLAIARA